MGRSAATSAADRIGLAMTGPRPGTISTSTPASFTGITMSLKKIAASTPWRRTGCSVISLASSGVRQASSIALPTRSSRYSGSERPACRMNHTGVTSGRSPRYARTRLAALGAGRADVDRQWHGLTLTPSLRYFR